MRLLILWPDRQSACAIGRQMEMLGWEADISHDGRIPDDPCRLYDVVLMHLCLPGMDGLRTGDLYAASQPLRPPRIVFAAPSQWCVLRPSWADCTVEAGVDARGLCALIETLNQKPLPRLAAATSEAAAPLIDAFLCELGVPKRLKGRAYAAWLLARMIPSTRDESVASLYAECAQAFGVRAASVERCVRIAVESIFTQGSMDGIERFFGATVDPERGKPTNRAFLMQAAQQLRLQLAHSRATAFSPNSSEMHHNPAAPTSV